jgi:hypothetical protein
MPMHCPHCGRDLPQYRNVTTRTPPAEGHVALCMYCDRFSFVTPESTLRVPTPDEGRRLEADPNAARALELLRAALRAGGTSSGEADGIGGPNCPSCGASNRGAVNPTGRAVRAKAGDWSICLHCGALNRYIAGPAGLTLRAATEPEITALQLAASARHN